MAWINHLNRARALLFLAATLDRHIGRTSENIKTNTRIKLLKQRVRNCITAPCHIVTNGH